jgi:hypothetical protein
MRKMCVCCWAKSLSYRVQGPDRYKLFSLLIIAALVDKGGSEEIGGITVASRLNNTFFTRYRLTTRLFNPFWARFSEVCSPSVALDF